MRWQKGRRSSNIEDRRGQRMGRGVKLGGGVTIIAIVAALFLGQDPGAILSILDALQQQTGAPSTAPSASSTAGSNDEASDFVSVVLADTEDTWSGLFSAAGQRYQPPKLVLFSDIVQSACGINSAASGPFYCPPDQRVYLDLSFSNELQRMGASGDFAMAYVIDHEIGHHVQNLVGVSAQVQQLQSRSSRSDANALSLLTELQADCYAGVWAHHGHRQRNILELGDVEEAIGAASAVGDDRLLKAAGRRVHPDSFTHGSSEQRIHWLSVGLKSGDIKSCDTFDRARGQ